MINHLEHKNKMSYSYSKLGGKYLLKDIENTDKLYHDELQRMYKKLNCECGNKHCTWVTLRRGGERFVCINCAQKLRADSQNKIKSAMGTYRWHPDEMDVIRKRYTTESVVAATETTKRIASRKASLSHETFPNKSVGRKVSLSTKTLQVARKENVTGSTNRSKTKRQENKNSSQKNATASTKKMAGKVKLTLETSNEDDPFGFFKDFNF